MRFEIRITLSYLLFGLMWILFSDMLLDFLINDHGLLTKFQTYKGTFFVFVTAAFFYLFVERHMHKLRSVEARIKERERHYKSLFDDNHSIIVLINPEDGKIEDANPAACKYYGYKHAELCTKTVRDFYQLTNDQVENWFHAVNADEQNHVFLQLKLSGNDIREVEVYFSKVNIANKTMIYSISHDITEQRNAESKIRILSQAIEQSPVGICITNTAAKIEYSNPMLSEITGYAVDELLNQNIEMLGVGEMSKQHDVELWETILSGGIWTGEFRNKRKDGELYWESDTISATYDATGQITHFLAIKEDVTNRKSSEISLKKSKELLRKFATHLQTVRENEKIALAREIHDDLGQNLVALKIEAGLLRNNVKQSLDNTQYTAVADRFDRIISVIENTIKAARRIMNGLRPELLEMNGFISATSTYLEEFKDRYNIDFELEIDNFNVELNAQQSLTFYRILQEALSNVAKHSMAKQLVFSIYNDNDSVYMDIVDNGVGFDMESNTMRQDSYGMLGMQERVVLLGGELNVNSELGKGTKVSVSIPINNIKVES